MRGGGLIHVVKVEHYTRLDCAEEKNNLSFAQKKTQLGMYVCSHKLIFVKNYVLWCMHWDIVIVTGHNMPRCGVQLQSIGISEQIGAMSAAAPWLVQPPILSTSNVVNSTLEIVTPRHIYWKCYNSLKLCEYCVLTHGSLRALLTASNFFKNLSP